MKAVAIEKFGDTEVFRPIEIPEPAITEDEIIIEVTAGSVNPIDCKQRKGKHRFIFGAPFPIVLGYDVSGIVKKKGSKIKRFNIGDRVCGVLSNRYGGGLAQYAIGKEHCFVHVPENVDLNRTAALPLAGLTALQALRDKGKVKPGSKVLIIGAAGGVGHYAQQISSLLQANITSVSSNVHRFFLTQLSEHTFVDYNSTDILKLIEKFDVIFDTTGKYTFLTCRRLLNPGGIYINTLPRPKILIHKFVSLFCNGRKAKTLLMKHDPDDLQVLINWVSEGKLKICIEKVFPIGDVSKAHEHIENGHTEGKILIKYDWTD